MRRERSYVQPSCVLQVWWQAEVVLNDRLAPQDLRFRLHFRDNQCLEGDLPYLWTVVQGIDSYGGNFLQVSNLPECHYLLGLKLTSTQLMDARAAIEALRGEVLLLPASAAIPRQGGETLKTVIVGIASLTMGAMVGVWLASRSHRSNTVPSGVVEPAPQPGSRPAPPPPGKHNNPPFFPPPPQPQSPPKLPPIRVYPRPPAPPPAEKVEPPPTPPEPRAAIPDSQDATPPIPEPVPEAPEAAAVPRTVTIDAVEIATSETLTNSLLEYLRSNALPQGQVTIDITIEGGKVAGVGVEGGDGTLWSQLLQNWTPPEETGRVRLQIAVP